DMMQKFQREYQRAQCIALGKAGMTYRIISTIVNMSKSSVQRAVKHFEEKSDFYDRRGSDRPKKLNDRNVRMFKHLVQTGHRYSAREIMLKLKISIKIPKLFLNKNDKKDRLDWCLEYSNWTINEWKDVTFSDELIFFVIKRKNETKIWRTTDERWKDGCMHVAAMGGNNRVGFWVCITSKGTGCFRIYSENTNSDVYCNILENYLIPAVQRYQMKNKYFYQYYNAQYHVSRRLKGNYMN
ncbi:unnamed protein product, partial [Rotaria sp. Silwood1]